MRIRRTLAATLTAALASVLALSACGSGTPGVSAGNDQSSAAGNGPVTINFWSQQFEDYQTAWEKKWIATFNSSQNQVKVNLIVVPADAWEQKLKAAQAANKAPDVYTINYGSIAPAVADGKLKALDDMLPASAFDDLADNVKTPITVGGKHYAYPWNAEPSAVLYYRKDLFTAAGLDPAKPPADWAELTNDAKLLTKDKVFGITTASTAVDLAWSSWGLQYDVAGHLPMSPDWSQALANDPSYVSLANFYKTLYSDGSMPKQALAPYADGAPLGQGKVAMQITGSWVIGQLRQSYPKMLDNIAVAPVPSMNGGTGQTTATLGGWTLAVDAKSTKAQQGAEFIKYLLAGDTSVMLDYFKAAGFSKYSPRTSVAKAIDADATAKADPFRKIISDQVVPYAKPEATYPNDLNVYFATAIEKSMKGGDPTQALADAQQQMTSYISKNRLAGTNPQAGK